MDSVGVSNPERSPNRILAVADWSVDPRVVARALRARSMIYPTVFSLLVPSRLPGLDWVGNPNASRPCATQQLAELEQLCRVSNVSVATASVGDPERLPAITAALETWPAKAVLLFERERLVLAHPLRLPNRVKRSTGLPVETIEVPSRVRLVQGNRRAARRAERCAVASA
jgi:hypothetical protein